MMYSVVLSTPDPLEHHQCSTTCLTIGILPELDNKEKKKKQYTVQSICITSIAGRILLVWHKAL